MRIRTLLATWVAFGAAATSVALAQPAVDESPDGPPEGDAPEAAEASPAVEALPDAPPAAAPTPAAAPADAKKVGVGAKPARTSAAVPAAAPAVDEPQPLGTEEDGGEDEGAGDLPATPEVDPATAQALEDGLPSWEPVPMAPGVVSAGGGDNLTANWDAAGGPSSKVSYPWVESHGYFRIRADLFHNLDLDTYDAGSRRGSSSVLPPLTELPDNRSPNPEDVAAGHRYKRGADTLASTNVRFRYQPTLHISENLRVKTTLDVLDNLVLGSTPAAGAVGGNRGVVTRPDVPIEGLSDTQEPPDSGVNGYRDSVRVKHLWGEWKTPLGLLTFGRMQAHWGLGMVQNSGNCLDCDFGDSVDRIMGVTKLFGTYVAAAWDFPSEGLVGFSGLNDNVNQSFGQQRDFDQRDDVNQYMVSFFDKPVTREEQEVRKRDLDELHKPVFDWGVYSLIRHQLFSSETATLTTPPTGASDVSLMDAKLFTFTPDLWLDFQYHPDALTKYRVQFEAAAVIGSIDEVPILSLQSSREGTVCLDDSVENIADCPADERISPRKRDLLQFGYTLQFDAHIDRLKWGVHHGFATGDKSSGFGILDRNPLDSNDPADIRDQDINNFKFDRDFIVDMILFREVLGGVTNATYFKPYIGYNFIQDEREAWGFQVASIYSMAVVPESTPGNARNLGLEFDFELYIHEFERFRWSLAYGVLVPFSGLDLLNENRTQILAEPGVAQTLQMNIGMQF